MLQIGKKRGEKLVAKFHSQIQEIYSQYWEMENYVEVYESCQVMKSRYRYTVKEIAKKYGLTAFEVIFLTSRAKGPVGICQYCGEDKFIYRARTSIRDMSSCDCKGICKLCSKIYKEDRHENKICSNCYWKAKDLEEAKRKAEIEKSEKENLKILSGLKFEGWLSALDIEGLSDVIFFAKQCSNMNFSENTFRAMAKIEFYYEEVNRWIKKVQT